MHSHVFHRCLVTANRVSDDADNGFFSAQWRKEEKLKGRQGEIWMRQSLYMNPNQRLGYGGGWLEGGLKRDGLFANCGHFWPEHDRFNDYFNVLLNTTETWNAIVREASVLDICFQPLDGREECSFIVQV